MPTTSPGLTGRETGCHSPPDAQPPQFISHRPCWEVTRYVARPRSWDPGHRRHPDDPVSLGL
jgi:hypothetical protein